MPRGHAQRIGCMVDSTQTGASEALWGIKMYCCGDSLQEQCTRSDIENWVHFVRASWCSNSNKLNFIEHVDLNIPSSSKQNSLFPFGTVNKCSSSPQQNIVLKSDRSHEENCRYHMSMFMYPCVSRPPTLTLKQDNYIVLRRNFTYDQLHWVK